MNSKRIIAINAAILCLGIGIWMATKWSGMGIGEKFATFLLLTLGAAFGFVLFILPAMGDWIGNLFYSAPEEAKPDKYTEAASKLAQGDYNGAIKAYQSITRDEPEARFPHIEIAKIQVDHLHDPDAAINTVQTALDSRQWPENDAAFLMFRLADLYHEHKQDDETTKAFLNRVIESFPETRHSANARHKLNELEQADQRHH